MKNLVDIIESLRSTLEMREKGYKSGENRLSSRVEQCAQYVMFLCPEVTFSSVVGILNKKL